jgi:carbon starvation protein CstA
MLTRESDARLIGYGGMLMERFVAMMAMVGAVPGRGSISPVGCPSE